MPTRLVESALMDIAPEAPVDTPSALAAQWYDALADRYLQRGAAPLPVAAPDESSATLAAFAALALARGKSLLLLVPGDEDLPALSSALDLALRPLCLVLPSADFAARIALRATLSLLKSRLSRDGDDEQGLPWQAQRERLKPLVRLWDDAQSWNAANDRSQWPLQVAQLFPVRILPVATFRQLPPQVADITLSFGCRVDPALLSGWQLQVGSAAHASSRSEVQAVSEDYQLRMELAQLSQDVAELELELATAQAEMSEFTHRYYRVVGRRMSELDALQAKLARLQVERLRAAAMASATASAAADAATRAAAEAATLEERAERSRQEEARFADAAASEAPAFRPGQDIKRLFRQLAQKIHPDRASDETNRAWRTQLMSEANRAYRAGDIETLREIGQLWEEQAQRSPGVVDTPAAAAVETRGLKLQIQQMQRRFAQIKSELNHLFGSRLYELFLAARQAARFGRDLLCEMAERLDGQIADALASLDLART